MIVGAKFETTDPLNKNVITWKKKGALQNIPFFCTKLDILPN